MIAEQTTRRELRQLSAQLTSVYGYLSHRQVPKQKSQQLYKYQISPCDWSHRPMQLSLQPAAVKAPGPPYQITPPLSQFSASNRPIIIILSPVIITISISYNTGSRPESWSPQYKVQLAEWQRRMTREKEETRTDEPSRNNKFSGEDLLLLYGYRLSYHVLPFYVRIRDQPKKYRWGLKLHWSELVQP